MKSKRWKLKRGQKFYYIAVGHSLSVLYLYYFDGIICDVFLESGNFFTSKRKAQAKLRAIKKILKETEDENQNT